MANRVIYTAPTIRHVVYTTPYDAEVEYLGVSKGIFIDTGIIGDNNTSIDCGFMRTSGKNFNLIGARYSGLKVNEYSVVPYINGATSMIFGQYEATQLNSTVITNNTYFRCLTQKINFKILDAENNVVLSKVAANNTFQTDGNLVLFGSSTTVGNSSNTNFRVYYFKIYSSDTLVRDFIPVRIGSIGYMYDKVSGRLFANKGTGNFVLGNDVANPVPKIRRVIPMPYDRKVEYLEVDNTATCYIDTGVFPSNSISVVARIQVLEGYNGFLFEGGKEGGVNEIGFLLKTEQGKVDFRFGNKVMSAFYTFPTEPFLISSFDNPNVLVVNGTNFGVTSPTFSTNYLYSIYLFGQHRINTSSGSAKNCRIYWFKMYNNGVLTRDFIPVRKNGIGYMYDRVSGKLFGNSGTGNFILGNDIN